MYLRITNSGLLLTAGTAVTSGAVLPTDSSGNPPRHIRITTESNSNGNSFAYIKLGTAAESSTTVATFSNTLVNSVPTLLHSYGFTHISCITRALTCVINVLPLED